MLRVPGLTTIAVVVVFAANLAVAPAANAATALERIIDGDYVWSIDFPQRESALFGYAQALRGSLEARCSGAFSVVEVAQMQTFMQAWAVHTQLSWMDWALGEGDFDETAGMAATALATAAQRDRAERDVTQLVANRVSGVLSRLSPPRQRTQTLHG